MWSVRDTTIAHRAPDKKAGMTFADLRLFVQDCMHADIPDDTKVEAYVGFRAQIQRIEVTVKEGPQ